MADVYAAGIRSFDQRPDLKGTETARRGNFAPVVTGFDQRPDLKGTETLHIPGSGAPTLRCFDQRPDLKGTETPTWLIRAKGNDRASINDPI